MISPAFRTTLLDALGSGLQNMDKHSPWSYVGAGALTLVFLMVYLYRAAQPR
jgi:hypothetical protein